MATSKTGPSSPKVSPSDPNHQTKSSAYNRSRVSSPSPGTKTSSSGANGNVKKEKLTIRHAETKSESLSSLSQHYPKEHELLLELNEHNDFFDMLVEMIPSKIYLANMKHSNDNEDNDDENTTKYGKNQQQRNNALTKDGRKAIAKLAKRQKLNPPNEETLQQQQKPSSNLFPTVPLTQSNNNDAKGTNHQTAADSGTYNKGNVSKSRNGHGNDEIGSYQSRIEALRMKLQMKLAEKKSNSKADLDESNNPTQMSKRAQRRLIKQQRREEAMKRTKTVNNIPKKADANFPVSASTINDNNKNADDVDIQNIDYGKISGFDQQNDVNKSYSKINKSLANVKKPKNLHKMLEDAKAKKQLLQEYKNSNQNNSNGNNQDSSSSLHEKVTNMIWSDVYKEADGVRIRDDPTKIKKQIQKKVKKKEKSTKSWKDRIEKQNNDKKKRQMKRQQNLLNRHGNLDNDTTTTSTTDAKTSSSNSNGVGNTSQPKKTGGRINPYTTHPKNNSDDNENKSDNNNKTMKKNDTPKGTNGTKTHHSTKKQQQKSRPGFEGRKSKLLNKGK